MAGAREAGAAVAGIGGVFLYSSDPARLAEWYRRHLGIDWVHNEAERAYYHDFLHRDHADPSRVCRTAWAIMARKPGAAVTGQIFMVNYRVADLAKFLEHLKALGIAIEKIEDYEYGRFAWISDRDGNRIELFEDRFC
jgi:catechol 2,3-dioxygenase-like lactoylglutathione lyase family enzyme